MSPLPSLPPPPGSHRADGSVGAPADVRGVAPDSAPGDEPVDAAVQGVWARLRDTITARVDVIDEAVAALVEGRLDEPIRADAERAAHKLAGSAGTFGFHDATRLARQLEHRFAADPDIGEARAAAEAVVALRSALEAPDEPPASTPAMSDDHPATVLVLTSDGGLVEGLRRAGASRGLHVRAAATPRGEAKTRAEAAPDAVVLDGRVGRARDGADEEPAPGRPSADRASPAVTALETMALPEGTPTVLLADADAQPDRVAAVRAGVDRFVARTAGAEEVVATVDELVRAAEPARVLACDDDVAVLEATKAVLRRSGIPVETVADSRGFWDALTTTQPDLVLLDISMPHVDGLELCRTLRSDPAHMALPVVFLTGHTDRGSVQEAFDAGADDVVGKPLVDAELRARVGNRLERARLLRRLADADPLTGLANRPAAAGELQRLVDRSRRHDQPLALAVLEVDGIKAVTEAHGHAAGEAVLGELARRLRAGVGAGDVVARWGWDTFVVGMDGMGRHDGVQRMAEVLEKLRAVPFEGEERRFAASFSAGIAEHPVDGCEVDALYRVAGRSLARAQRAGGDQVRTADPGEDDDAAACSDVVLVEDDPSVAGLVTHALRTRGHGVDVLDDGGEARRRLVGPDADLHPRVVLLDVDLPALNGLDLLAELRRHGVLDRTRVVMLTGRGGETDVVDALRSGAVDYVAKPFSLPELLERVRRALAG